MHDMSGGGCGFWSKENIPEHTELYVRDWSPQGTGAWVRGTVMHSTVGIAGFRIGVAFVHSLTEEPGSTDNSSVKAARRNAHPHIGPAEQARFSLRTRSIVAAAGAYVAGALAAYAVCAFFRASASWFEVLLLASAFSLVFAALLAWFAGRSDVRYLKFLQTQMQCLARGQADPSASIPVPSRETARLQRTLTQLKLIWNKRKEWENESLQRLAAANELKSNILSTVSNDFRTLIASILINAKALEEKLANLAVDDQRSALRLISEESTRLAELVDGLLDAQHLQSDRLELDMKPTDLAATIRNCHGIFRPLAENKSIDLSVECDRFLPPVEADAEKIGQMLSNIVSNALKYTPSGGEVQISAVGDTDEVVICVSDGGPGIPRDQWDQIFDRFAKLPTSNPSQMSGVGLGLHIVRQIVDHHGGRVWLDSEVGVGSSFYVALNKVAPPKDPSSPDCVERKPASVLICDADPGLASRMRQVLHHNGFAVHMVHSGCRLLAMLEQERPKVVVTDILVPDMDAVDLLRAIKAKRRHRFGLVVHSYGGEGDDLRRQGVDIFLKRPAKAEDLLEGVKVAGQKLDTTGMTVLVVGRRAQTEGLDRVFREAGHTPVFAATADRAVGKLQTYSVGAVFVAEAAIDPGWVEAAALRKIVGDQVLLLVMCDHVGRSQRKLAERRGVTCVQRKPDQESELLASLQDVEMAVAAQADE